MTKYIDVANCFDSGFYMVRGEHPDPNKKMGDDYTMSLPNVLAVLHYTGAALSAKGWRLEPGIDANKCLTETIAQVLQDINANTVDKVQPPPKDKPPKDKPSRGRKPPKPGA